MGSQTIYTIYLVHIGPDQRKQTFSRLHDDIIVLNKAMTKDPIINPSSNIDKSRSRLLISLSFILSDIIRTNRTIV